MFLKLYLHYRKIKITPQDVKESIHFPAKISEEKIIIRVDIPKISFSEPPFSKPDNKIQIKKYKVVHIVDNMKTSPMWVYGYEIDEK